MVVKKHILQALDAAELTTTCNVFVEELMKIYQAEKKLNLTLPKMILNAKSPETIKSLTVHLKFTQEHLLRLETLFKSINQPIIS
jgi:ferritin-like metal-binding protein YciE